MLRKILVCGFLMLIAAPALGQAPKPSPSPSPAPAQAKPSPRPSPSVPKPTPAELRAYTESRVKTLTASQKIYDEACDQGADFDRLEATRNRREFDAMVLISALTAEVVDNRDLRQATDDLKHAQGNFKRERDKGDKGDYVAYLKAQGDMHAAEQKMYKVYNDAIDKLLKVVDPDGVLDRGEKPCPRHQAMLDAKADKEAKDAANKALYEKIYGPPKPSPTPTPKPGDDCNKGPGINGRIEKLACEEGRK